MKINLETCTEVELWRFVGLHLNSEGIDAVLVGGAVVSIYSKGAYQSGDLDFVILNLFKDKLPDIMAKIGFKKKGRHYVHPDCKHLFIEFPSGPLGIGEDTKIKPSEIAIGTKTLKILSPTDCIKDRLASYIHFKSQDTLDQAILVATAQPFNINAVKTWCQKEGAVEAFDYFRERLKTAAKKKAKK